MAGLLAWSLLLLATASAIVVALSRSMVATSSDGPPRVNSSARSFRAEALARAGAAAWVAQQVSPDAVVSCDPSMCAALRAQRVPAGRLLVLSRTARNPLRSAVVVATAVLRRQFGGRLDSVYAPGLIATFGTGYLRIEIRAIAPHGAAAYLAALHADLAARRDSGAQLAQTDRIEASVTAMGQLSTGKVDSRLLITIAGLAALNPVHIVAFGPPDPGGGNASMLRSAELADARAARADGLASVRSMLSYLRTQQGSYRALRTSVVRLAGGQAGLRVEFAAPSPLGLLNPGPTDRGSPRTR
jgi:hypothetical protein